MQFLENIKTSEKIKIDLVKQNSKLLIRKEINYTVESYKKLINLQHPFLPKIYDVSFKDNKTVVLEEYLQGQTLDKIQLSKRQSKECIYQLLDVLNFLHKNDILHRDIKPSNIMLCDTIKLIDFDASKTLKKNQTKDTILLVTRGYAPPEQYGFSDSNIRSDIYALGQTLKDLTRDKTLIKIANRCTQLEPKKRFSSVFSIKFHINLCNFTRFVLTPFLSFITALLLFSLTFITYGSVRHDIDGIYYLLGYNTPEIFSTVNNIELNSYQKNTLVTVLDGDHTLSSRIKIANQNNDYLPIFSCYKDEFDNYIFGAFSYIIDVRTGKIVPSKFEGVYLVSDTDYIFIDASESYIYKDSILYLRNLDIMK